MKPSVYIETTVPSYLTARPNSDPLVAAHQRLTRDWWRARRPLFDLFISQAVLNEARAGDPAAASERLGALRDLPLLAITNGVVALAERLCERVPIPRRAAIDGLHVALAAVHRMDYLLTWNCAHIANAVLRPMIQSVCTDAGHLCPIICTPLELMEDQE